MYFQEGTSRWCPVDGHAQGRGRSQNNFQEAPRAEPRSIFHFRPEHGNQAHHQARRVRRARSALTRPPFWALSLLNDLPILDQRGEVWGLFLLSRIEMHVTPITVLALQITEWKPCFFEAVRLQFAFVGLKWAETEFGCGIRPAVDPWTKPQPGSGAFFSDLAVTHFSGHLLRYHLDSLRPVQVRSIKLLPCYSRPLESPQSENPCPRLRLLGIFAAPGPGASEP